MSSLRNPEEKGHNVSYEFLLLFVVGVLASSQLHGQPAPRMGISPDRYYVEFDERGGDTQSLLVQNLSDQPLSLTLSVSNWELNENNQISVVPPNERSLDQWIVINPLNITIPPGSPQTIRWAIMPRLQPDPGEYRAIIFIEENLAQQEQQQNGTQVRMNMRYGLPIYAQVGEALLQAELHDMRIARTGDSLSLELSNVGTSHARMSGNYGIWPSAEFPGSERALEILQELNPDNIDEADFIVGNMPAAVILPGFRRSVPLPLGLERSGEFTIQLNAAFAQLRIEDALSFVRPDLEAPEDPAAFRIAGLEESTGLRLLESDIAAVDKE